MPMNKMDLRMDKSNPTSTMNGVTKDEKSPTHKGGLSSKKMDNFASPSQMVLTGSMVRIGGEGIGTSSGFQGGMQRFPKFHEFQCPLCPRSYAQKCSLYRHMKVHKDDKINESEVQTTPCTSGEGVFKCPFCIASYSNSASLNIHVRTHAVGYRDMVRKPEDSPNKDDSKIFPCPLCTRVFQRRSRLTVHLNISHRNEQYGDLPKDEENDADVESESDDVEDTRSRNSSVTPESPSDGSTPNGHFMCHLCGSSYTRRTNLNKHLEKRHNVDPAVLMTISGADFLTTDQGRPINKTTPTKPPPVLENNGERSESKKDTEYHCPYCTFETTSRLSLYSHLTNTHDDKEDLQDKIMDMAGKDEGEGTTEAKTGERKEGEEEIFPCSFCSRVYMRKCNLTQHLKMHFHDEAELKKKRPHLMMEDFMNETEENLEDVRQIIELTKAKNDDKEEVHECAICGLTFGVKVSLILHLKMHERRAQAKMRVKEKTSGAETTAITSPPPPLVRPGLSPHGLSPGHEGPGLAPHPQNPSMYVMTQDKDGKTTIHNQQAYMLSHLQVLNQVQHMIMYGRNPLLLPVPGSLPPSAIPRKRLSTGSLEEENGGLVKRMRPGPKPGRHWKSLECDPNRRPVKKCSLCSFEIADTNQEGLLQHMAAMHGVSCKLCPEIKFFAKRDFDKHCSQVHSLMCNPSEMEQLMVFGEILDSGNKMELVDPNEKEGKQDSENRDAAPHFQPLKVSVDDSEDRSEESPNQSLYDSMSYDGDEAGMGNAPMRQVCPKCGLHYAQKSSLNRHIRTHHNYSRVEEMVKAENLGLAPASTQQSTPQPRKATPPQPRKDMGSMGLVPAPLLSISQAMGGTPLLPPPLIPISNGLPAQGHLADINPTIARGLMYGLHCIPPPQILSPPVSKPHPIPLARSSPAIPENLKVANPSPDEEVSAINLSMSKSGVQDLSMKTLNSTSPHTASSSPATASPSAAPASKGRSRRKPKIVQRIVRNTTLEEEEMEDKSTMALEIPKVMDYCSDESLDNCDMTDDNANHEKTDTDMDSEPA